MKIKNFIYMPNIKSRLSKNAKHILKHYLKDSIVICLGVTSAAFGLKGFLLPNEFIDGGAMGISLLLNQITGIELGLIVVLVNLPFLIFGIRVVSISFTIKSILAIAILAMILHFADFPIITQDKLLIAVFGGFFLGTGIGLSIRGGAVIDGTEVLALYISRRTSLTVGDFIGLFNIMLFLFSMFIISIETALYSILIYFSASKTIDFILNGIEEYTGLFIVSDKADDIKKYISYEMHKGVTILNSEKGYGSHGLKQQSIVLYCVVTRLEVSSLLFEIEKIDPNAFIVQQSLKDIKGGLVKKRSMH